MKETNICVEVMVVFLYHLNIKKSSCLTEKITKDMKSNSFPMFLAIIATFLFFNCSNTRVKSPIHDEREEKESDTESQVIEPIAIEKQISFKAKETPIDSLDIKIEDLSIPELDRFFDIVRDSVFILSENEFNMARDLVKNHFAGVDTSISDDSIDDSNKPFPFNYYFKQYIGYKNHYWKKKLVYVNMFTGWHTPNGWVRELKNIWVRVYDGGKWDGHMIVDIENKEVVELAI